MPEPAINPVILAAVEELRTQAARNRSWIGEYDGTRTTISYMGEIDLDQLTTTIITATRND